MKYSLTFFIILLLISCEGNTDDAEVVITKAIKAHGGERYLNSTIEFDFRGQHFKAERNDGIFANHKYFDESNVTYHDVLNNDGFVRYKNGEEISLDKKRKDGLSGSVNSVIYFALLPYGLNDPAVQKSYLGESILGGKDYHKIKITFKQAGGGQDFDDEYIYWIDKNSYVVDYLAYYYHVNGGGTRFRKAVNSRTINGIRFCDYINYKASDNKIPPGDLDLLFEDGKLIKVSEIKLENINVKLSG